MLPRSQALQIYLKPGLKEDDLMLRVWEACRKNGRPQHVFRSMLRAGLIAMVESGDMPESVIEECGLDSLVERRRRRVSRHTDKQAIPQQPEPYPPYPMRYPQFPGYPQPQQYPHHDPAVFASRPVAHPRYNEEESRPSAPAELPPLEEERTTALAPAAPEPPQEKPIRTNPSTRDDESTPQRKLGKLM